MIYVLAAAAVLVIMVLFPVVRCAMLHPISLTVYTAVDLFRYIVRKSGNLLRTGEIIGYTGLFGKGKTLSAVHTVVSRYKAYNGKKVWCPRRKKFVTQRVHVISNVELNIPYEKLVSLEQVVIAAERQREYDDQHDTLTVTLVLGDEFSVQMHCRNFKTNVNPLLLNTILTCRHYYISIYYTAQRFGQVDALIRQVTSYVVECNKMWRFQQLSFYDAWDMENATTPTILKPFRRSCWFVKDRDYAAYDTLACVDNLKHEMRAGGMMSEAEILALQQRDANPDAIAQPSRRWLRRKKRTA